MAEILQAAKNEEENIIAEAAASKSELEQTMLRQQEESEQNAKLTQDIASAISREQAFKELRAQEAEDDRRRTYRIARALTTSIRIFTVLLFAIITLVVWASQGEAGISARTLVCSFILGTLSVAGFLDLLGVPVSKNLISFVEGRLAAKIYEIFYAPSV